MLAPAKINLFLHVSSPRPDGYHELEALVAFSVYGDELEFSPSDGIELQMLGPFAEQLKTDLSENIVLKAAYALRGLCETKDIRERGACVRLVKNLPIASGIGGGSSDAAATLKGLCTLWGISLDETERNAVGLSLGADVPVCLYGRSAWMSGIGEKIEAGPKLPQLPMVLVNPAFPLSTADVFRRFDQSIQPEITQPAAERPPNFDTEDSLLDYLRCQRNDLEPAAKELAPIIGSVLEDLKAAGASLVRMSGSGATCFGLFGEEGHARAAVPAIQARHPDWWAVATHLQP